LDPGFVRSKQQLIGNLDSHAEQLIDARPRPRFEGTVAEPRPGLRGGHIPGSRNVPYAELFDAKTGAMKSLDDLRQIFSGAGVDMTRPIVTTCGSGVSALVLTLALYRLGVRGTALYDGSWSEWACPMDRRSRRGRPERKKLSKRWINVQTAGRMGRPAFAVLAESRARAQPCAA